MAGEIDREAVVAYQELLEAAGLVSRSAALAADASDQAFYVVFSSVGMITNGGFAGLFQNPSGEYADLLPGACRTLGLDKYGDAAETALAIFRGDYPTTWNERDALWSSWVEDPEQTVFSRFASVHDEADAVWCDGEDEIWSALAAYVRTR